MGPAPQARSTDSGEAPTCPAHEVTLRTGTRVPVRPIRPDDADALQRFHSRLSEQTVVRRFFAWVPRLSDARATHFTQLAAPDRVALVALDPAQPGELIAVVRFDRTPGTDRAEYAAVVADGWQHRGLGAALTERLIVVARAAGVHHFDAYVLPENRPMLALFGQLGLPVQTHHAVDGVLVIAIDLGAGPPPVAQDAAGRGGKRGPGRMDPS